MSLLINCITYQIAIHKFLKRDVHTRRWNHISVTKFIIIACGDIVLPIPRIKILKTDTFP